MELVLKKHSFLQDLEQLIGQYTCYHCGHDKDKVKCLRYSDMECNKERQATGEAEGTLADTKC